MKEIPLLILANKQDLPNALSVNEIKWMLELDDLLKTHKHWQIYGLSKGESIMEYLNVMPNW